MLGPPVATADAPARVPDRAYDALARGVDGTAMTVCARGASTELNAASTSASGAAIGGAEATAIDGAARRLSGSERTSAATARSVRKRSR